MACDELFDLLERRVSAHPHLPEKMKGEKRRSYFSKASLTNKPDKGGKNHERKIIQGVFGKCIDLLICSVIHFRG
jgi:hypothetical protein